MPTDRHPQFDGSPAPYENQSLWVLWGEYGRKAETYRMTE